MMLRKWFGLTIIIPILILVLVTSTPGAAQTPEPEGYPVRLLTAFKMDAWMQAPVL